MQLETNDFSHWMSSQMLKITQHATLCTAVSSAGLTHFSCQAIFSSYQYFPSKGTNLHKKPPVLSFNKGTNLHNLHSVLY